MSGEHNKVISIDQYRTLTYPDKLRMEAAQSPTHDITLEQYTAGIAAMAEPGMSENDAIMHFFWTIADNAEDSADSLMNEHQHNHGFTSREQFLSVIRPMVHVQMLMLQGKALAHRYTPSSPSTSPQA